MRLARTSLSTPFLSWGQLSKNFSSVALEVLPWYLSAVSSAAQMQPAAWEGVVVRSGSWPICYRILGECVVDCLVERCGYRLLIVVVVDFHAIKCRKYARLSKRKFTILLLITASMSARVAYSLILSTTRP